MKHLFCSLLLVAVFAASPAAYAQKDKVVETSRNRKPAWIGTSDKTHFAVTEVGNTLAEAQDKAMMTIRQHIINAIAVNISSVEQMYSRQIEQNAIVSVLNDYASQVTTEAARIPYLKNISLSNAEDTYWERIYSKKTKSYRYEFSVLYPFTERTRREMIDAFIAIDEANAAHYERLRSELEAITNIDRIQQVLNELDGLDAYFFDSARKANVEALRRNYRALYNAISIYPESEELGRFVYSLRLNGRRVVTSHLPSLKSESVLEMGAQPLGDDMYLLSYDPQYASKTDINKIDIMYILGGARIPYTLFFNPAEGAVAVRPSGVVRFEQVGEKMMGTMSVQVVGQKAEVQKIVLWNPADGAQITTHNIDPKEIAEGERTLSFEVAGNITPSSNEIAIIKGVITVYNPKDKKSREVSFILPYKLITTN